GIFPILEERKNQTAGTLSGGEAQMLALGRALMSNPKLLILDEPSLGLAPKVILTMFDIIKEVNQNGVTIVLVEQNLAHALEVASRGYVLENGRIVLEDAAKNLKNNEHVKKAYLGY
ncbi:MAG: ATP-binding cassette domain-containing protein, partial [Candidatus Bathyarchaeia archaeon]